MTTKEKGPPGPRPPTPKDSRRTTILIIDVKPGETFEQAEHRTARLEAMRHRHIDGHPEAPLEAYGFDPKPPPTRSVPPSPTKSWPHVAKPPPPKVTKVDWRSTGPSASKLISEEAKRLSKPDPKIEAMRKQHVKKSKP